MQRACQTKKALTCDLEGYQGKEIAELNRGSALHWFIRCASSAQLLSSGAPQKIALSDSAKTVWLIEPSRKCQKTLGLAKTENRPNNDTTL
jgi:hypothetical protein